MSSQKPIGIGLLGAGTIGTGVINELMNKSALITSRIGRPLQIKGVLVRDLSKERPHLKKGISFTENAESLIKSDDVDIVVEMIGGEQPALNYIELALAEKKHVITANKEVMAKHGNALRQKAEQQNISLNYEASVGGGIPIIGALTHHLTANEIHTIKAIINGTTNYILSRMSDSAVSFKAALKEAQKLGFAEADPTNDINGDDAAYKLAILSSLAYQSEVKDSDVYREGIEAISSEDVFYAKELGYSIKLLATSKLKDQSLQARVHPSLIPNDHPLAKVNGVDNAIELEGDLVEWALFQGPGAGPGPTSSAILGDIINVTLSTNSNQTSNLMPQISTRYKPSSLDDLQTRYYLRLRAKDLPGVMAQISRVLGDMNVNLATVSQKEVLGKSKLLAEIVITTHLCKEESAQAAITQLKNLDVIETLCSFIRIEDNKV
tara:strand:- start:31258 stop:32568 length:1311 start_codon:yes stop_codon:yes gene_type:complete